MCTAGPPVTVSLLISSSGVNGRMLLTGGPDSLQHHGTHLGGNGFPYLFVHSANWCPEPLALVPLHIAGTTRNYLHLS